MCAFTKHFQWTDVRGLAPVCAELGYEGIDLTVRAGGHVLPERVADELPRAAEIIRAAGLKLAMITSPILDASTPHAEAIVKAMRAVGLRYYRAGPFRYDLARPLPPQVEVLRAKVRELAALNRQYGVCAMYHTHSGEGNVGSSQWDLYRVLEGLDAESVAVNYDIAHATVEGGLGGWVHSAHLMLPIAKGLAVKDFYWKKNAAGAWEVGWCPLGEGMVNFARFFQMVREVGFAGPLQLAHGASGTGRGERRQDDFHHSERAPAGGDARRHLGAQAPAGRRRAVRLRRAWRRRPGPRTIRRRSVPRPVSA